MNLDSDDQPIKRLLEQATSIAVVGIKSGADDDAFRVPAYLKAEGYRIIPVNPKLSHVLNIASHAGLEQIPRTLFPIDIVNIFRATEHLPRHVDEILSLSPLPRAVWTQLGIYDGPSAQRLREAGIEVIQDRCIMVDHRRLMENEAP
jgi:predicted CoA-binding protein